MEKEKHYLLIKKNYKYENISTRINNKNKTGNLT